MTALFLALAGAGGLGIICYVCYRAGISGQKRRNFMHRVLQAARRTCCATACAAMLLMPAASAGVSRGNFCEIYAPIYTPAQDTEETKSSCDANNAVWWEICAP